MKTGRAIGYAVPPTVGVVEGRVDLVPRARGVVWPGRRRGTTECGSPGVLVMVLEGKHAD